MDVNTRAGYSVFVDGIRLPVTPGKITTKISSKNKTIGLADGGEVNALNAAGLTDFEMDVLLPLYDTYAFAYYPDGFRTPDWYLARFAKIIAGRKPVPLDIVRIRYGQTGKAMTAELLYQQSLRVSVESYTVKEDAANGPDTTVTLKLRQYVDYGTKIVRVIDNGSTATVETARETDNAPEPPKTYTVKAGDTLWSIAKYYTGDGARYTELQSANDLQGGSISVGQELILPW